MALYTRASRFCRLQNLPRQLKLASAFSNTSRSRESNRLEDDIAYLKEQDAFWLFRTSRECSIMIKWLESEIPRPQPLESLLKSAGHQEYICTQSWENASLIAKARDSMIEHLKTMQGHCKDLSTEPYPEWNEEAFRKSEEDARQGQTDEEYRLTLEVEEETVRPRLEADLDRFENIIKQEEKIVKAGDANGTKAAVAMIKSLRNAEDANFMEDDGIHDDAILDAPSFNVDSPWDDLQAHVENQIEREGR